MMLAVALIVLVIGSVLFHILSPWYLTPLASNWGMIDLTIDITFWVTGFVFVAVNLFMAYCVIRYRYNPNRRSEYNPENKKLEWWLTGLTTIGVVAMLTPGLFVWGEFVTVPEGTAEVEAVGQQWHWTFRLPGKDGEFGSVDATLVSADNPFGMNPEDPKGQDDILVENGEVHLPVDVPVKMLLRSKDVLHDFAVAQFRVKMDMVPGSVSYLWLEPTVPGRYEILCEELCGIGHFAMRGVVVVDEQSDFDKWLDEQPTYAEIQAVAVADAMAGAANYAVCTACHGAQGEGNLVLNAPKIAGQQAWYTKRQIGNYKSGRRGAHSDDVYGQQMAPMAATLFNDKAINNVAAYIETLPDVKAEVTISTGDADSGERIWRNCAVCHGERGEGIQAMNAPRQAGMSDWYIARQLRNFKNEIRGGHDQDLYGQQMVRMANILITDQAVDDVVAYINTL